MNVNVLPPVSNVDRDKIYQWIIELGNPDTRENALLELRFAWLIKQFNSNVWFAV